MYKTQTEYLASIIQSIKSNFGDYDAKKFDAFCRDLGGNKKFRDSISSLLTKYRAITAQIRNDYDDKKIDQTKFTTQIQSTFSELDKEVLRLSDLYLKDFQPQGLIARSYKDFTTGKSKVFILSAFIANLSGVSVSNTPNSFINALHEVITTSGVKLVDLTPTSASGDTPSASASASASASTEKPAKLAPKLRAALGLLWQTNAGSKAIKEKSPIVLKEVLREIREANSSVVAGNPYLLDMIRDVIAKKTGPELSDLMNRYINEGDLSPTTDFFRGVSDENYKYLLALSKTNGIYSPDTFLATTSVKNVASTFGRVIRVEGAGATYIANRLFGAGMWSSDEDEYLFPRNTKFMVIDTGNGNLLLREVNMGDSGKQELIPHEQMLLSVVSGFSNIARDSHATVHFAPQAFLLGDYNPDGVCDSLSQAWLSMLSADESGSLKNALLNNIFLRSQSLIQDATAQGRLPGDLPAQSQAFLNAITGLHSSGPRVVQSLDDIIHTLTGASGDLFLSLHTGNHALALARRTLNGKATYFFYDPNIGEVSLPVSGSMAEQTAALHSLITNILNLPATNGHETLADYYQMVSRNGEYTFTVQTTTGNADKGQPQTEALKKLLQTDTPSAGTAGQPSVPEDVPPLTLTPEVESVRQAAQTGISEPGYVALSQHAAAQAYAVMAKIQQEVIASAGNAANPKITGMDVASTPDDTQDHFILKIRWQADGVSEQTLDISFDRDDFALFKPVSEAGSAGEGIDFSGAGKPLSAYFIVSSLFGLLSAAAKGNTQGIIANSLFIGMTFNDFTGLSDKLASHLASLMGVTDESILAGGLNGLLSKGVSELSSLLGMSDAVAHVLGETVGNIPVVGLAAGGYSLYGDIESLQNTSGEQHTDAIIRTTVDAAGLVSLGVTGVISMIGLIDAPETAGLSLLASSFVAAMDFIFSGQDGRNGFLGGLDDALHPGDVKIDNFIHYYDKFSANKPEQLFRVRNGTDDKNNEINTLTFTVASQDFASGGAFYQHPLTKLMFEYFSTVSDTDAIKDAFSDTGNLMTQFEKWFNAGSHAGTYSDEDFTFWKSILDKLLGDLGDNGVSQDDYCNYVLSPDAPLPLSAVNGNMNVTLDEDGMGFSFGWTSSFKGYDEGDHDAMYDTQVQGPTNMPSSPVHLTKMVNDIVMGSGRVLNVTLTHDNAEHEVPSHNGGSNPSISPDATDDLGWADSYKTSQWEGNFTANGNSHDNKFYSTWQEESVAYHYTINGKGGDDTLFTGEYGTYTFDGGENGSKGDTIIAYQTDAGDKKYTVYNLDSGPMPYDISGLTLRSNFSAKLTNVENIYGSVNNEIFHGSAGKNTIVTGGGSDYIYLSGGGDTYIVNKQVSHNSVEFWGQADRVEGAAKDTVYLTDIDLQDLILPPASASQASPSIIGRSGSAVLSLQKGSEDQLIFITRDKACFYKDSGIWTLDLSASALSPDVSSLPSIISQGLPTQLQNCMGTGTFNLLLKGPGTSGITGAFRFAGGKPVAVTWVLPANYKSVSNIADAVTTCLQNSAGIPSSALTPHPVMFETPDGLDFTIETRPGTDGHSETSMILDVSRPDAYFAGSAGNATLFSMADRVILQYRSPVGLTASSLSGLWGQASHIIMLPGGYALNTSGASNIHELLMLDNGNNAIDVQFEQGTVSQIVFKTNELSGSGTFNPVGLLEQARDILGITGIDHLHIQTADGVMFHFAAQPQSGDISHPVLVVDSIDPTAYKKAVAQDPNFAGITVGEQWSPSLTSAISSVFMDITGLVHASLPLCLGISKTPMVLQYQSSQILTPEQLSSQQWQKPDSSSSSLAMLKLPDGTLVYAKHTTALQTLTLLISDPAGHHWQMIYQQDPHGDIALTQATDTNGLSNRGILQGQAAVFCAGDSIHKAGVTVDLSQQVQHGGEMEGEQLAGVNLVYGSSWDDVLSGNSGNNTLYGRDGKDVLSGGGGTDLLIGGAGADAYVIKTGDQVVISAQDNGTSTDTLVFAGVTADSLSFTLKDDDLIISSTDRVAVLKDWKKGNTHYALALKGDQLSEVEFGNLVQGGLSEPHALRTLSDLYAALLQGNQQQVASEMTPYTLGADKWHKISAGGPPLLTSGTEVVLTNQMSISQDTGVLVDSNADYKLLVDVDYPADMLNGFHLHLKAGDKEVSGTLKPVVSDGQDMTTHHLELDIDGSGLTSLDDGKATFSVEIDEDGGKGGSIIHSVQLQKLTGAMAIFGSGGGQGSGSGSVPMAPPVVQPQLTVA